MRIKYCTEYRPNGPPPRLGVKAASPSTITDEDCNSNTSLGSSQHSTHDDIDAPCDNSGYLWFMDYNPIFRDSSGHHTSVLSSVSASYKGIGDLTSRFEFTSRYNDLSRDLDVNLAEVDMESFKTEDIHALLMTGNLQHDAVMHDEKGHDGEESLGSLNTMSICKSELLFSPVKEPIHGVHFSVDSLDCELPTEQDLILTCQANKDNYTIAFEGSLTTYSEDVDYIEHTVNQKLDNLNKQECNLELDNDERTRRNLVLLEKCKKLTNKLTTSMAKSDFGLTTWSKLKKQNSQTQLTRHPSGNNNDESSECTETIVNANEMNNSVIKSQSLPNLSRNKIMYSSINSAALSNSTVDSFTINHRLTGTSPCMKVYDVAHNRSHSQHSEPMSTSSSEHPSASDKVQLKQPINLVKLFMKQKSLSNDGIGIDQSDRSECWPSSSGGESDSIGEQRSESAKYVERPPHELPEQITEEITHVYAEVQTSTHYATPCEDIFEEDTHRNRLSDGEAPIYATVNKSHKRNNLNVMNSPARNRNTRKTGSSHYSQSSATSFTISSCSESDGTQITRLHRLMHKEPCDNKATSTHMQTQTIDRSMQTSSFQTSTVGRELFKVIEPSFLKKLKEGDCEKPVYVLYPNYTLPDLGFLTGKQNIYLNPLKVNMSPKANDSRRRMPVKGKRPFSCNDLEILKKKGLGHIKDWDSLNFLLPTECKQILSEVPELMEHVKEKDRCASTPIKPKNRPMSCDCNHIGQNTAVSSSSSTTTQPSSGYRGSSTILTDSSAQNSPAPGCNVNPLFVYRYDSATSSEASTANSEGHRARRSLGDTRGRFAEATPPRPPLPKSILRKSIDKNRKTLQTKRYSMFEIDDIIPDPIVCMNVATEHKMQKRRSLQEPYYLQNQHEYKKNNDIAAKRMSQQFLDAADKDCDYNEYYHDEGVGTESSIDSGKSNEIKYRRPRTPPFPKTRTKNLEYMEFPPPSALISSADLQQLEEFLKLSGVDCQNMNEWDQNQVQKAKSLAEIPICEEGEISPDECGSPKHQRGKVDVIDISQKRALVSNVTDAVEMLIQHFSVAADQEELAFLGDSSQSPVCAKIALNALCPALYAIFRDGLKESIDTSFGAVNNSVWQMVEGTARQGPIAKSLNELVLRINSEDAVTEGLVKFNAFILGLLNAQSVDAWVTYVRTRESVLAKHYGPDSLILAGCVGEPRCRALLDTLLASLEPLRLLPFSLDLMFEMKELHRSFKRIESEMRAASRPTTINMPPLTLNQRNLLKLVRSIHSSVQSEDAQNSVIMRHKDQPKNKEPSTPDLLNDSANKRPYTERSRPRSCMNPSAIMGHDLCPNNSRIDFDTRRWSGVQLGSKLMQAFDQLGFENDECAESKTAKSSSKDVKLDSSNEDWRPPSASSGSNSGGCKFRRLQLKWEMMSNQESPSQTPSGETSPAAARGSKIPRPVSSPVRPQAPTLQSPVKNAPRGIPVLVRKASSPTTPRAPSTMGRNSTGATKKQPANRVAQEYQQKQMRPTLTRVASTKSSPNSPQTKYSAYFVPLYGLAFQITYTHAILRLHHHNFIRS